MPHKWRGISNKDKPQMDHLKTALVFGKIMKGVSVQVKQKVVKETVRREPYNREEDKLRPKIIEELRRLGWRVWRIEPSFRGRFGLGDLWGFNFNKYIAGWIEIKTPDCVLSVDQRDFQRLCGLCGVHYWIIRAVEDCKNIC